jgi:hypothetical protein
VYDCLRGFCFLFFFLLLPPFPCSKLVIVLFFIFFLYTFDSLAFFLNHAKGVGTVFGWLVGWVGGLLQAYYLVCG